MCLLSRVPYLLLLVLRIYTYGEHEHYFFSLALLMLLITIFNKESKPFHLDYEANTRFKQHIHQEGVI